MKSSAMSKFKYISRQLARAQHKKDENYVVSRVWHHLNDLDIKFITQQYVIRDNGSHALTDMYFPQFGIHIEVNEPYHLNQVEQDRRRADDIIRSTQHDIKMISTGDAVGVEDINKQVDKVVALLRELKQSKIRGGSFVPWDPERESNPDLYIGKGYISLADNVEFDFSWQAASCFGKRYTIMRRGGVNHPVEHKALIWFPKLYENEGWINSISDDETQITERAVNPVDTSKHVRREMNSERCERIVFARVKGPLGDVMYKFKGRYVRDNELSNEQNGLVWKKIADSVDTYQSSVATPKLMPM